MATYDLTAAGGTTGHPANGRTPYLVENTIDVSAVTAILELQMETSYNV